MKWILKAGLTTRCMIISCPYCQTRYQVAAEAIGSAGRKVQCASCRRAWQAAPPDAGGDDDTMFERVDEEALDAAFGATEDDDRRGRVVAMPGSAGPGGRGLPAVADVVARAASAVAEVPGAAAASAAQRAAAYSKRQRRLRSGMPIARFKRVLRLVAVILFVGLMGVGLLAREQIVRQVPEMDGFYSAIGLGVNVVGLEISRLNTLASTRNGREVLNVTAEIANVAGRPVPVPPVLVTVRDAEGRALYEWSVMPAVSSLDSGEMLPFEARLASPPPGAVSVRLSFARGRPQAPIIAPSPLIAPAPKDAH